MKPYKYWLLILIAVLVLAVLAGAAGTAWATEFDNDGYVGPDEVIDDDLFVSSDTVTVDGTVNGNLFASGGRITINGTVGGDLFVTGAEVEVNGTVGGNLAFAGQLLSLNGAVDGSLFATGNTTIVESSGRIARNIYFFGYSLDLDRGSQVGRDVRADGSQVRVRGQVGRHLQSAVASLVIEGTIGGDVYANVAEPGSPMAFFPWPNAATPLSPGIHVDEDAQIDGRLTYTSSAEQAAAIRATPGGGVEYRPDRSGVSVRVDIGQTILQWLISRVRELITLLILGGLVVWQIPAALDGWAAQVRARPLPATGWGLVSLVVGFVGSGIVAVVIVILGILVSVITLGGLARAIFGVGFSVLGLVFVLFLLAVAYGSKLAVAYPVGRWLLGRLAPGYSGRGWALVLGIAVYMLLRLIPLVAALAAIAATLVGLGAIWLWLRQQRLAQTAAPEQEVALPAQ